jgi:hypothetical protein
MAYVDIHAGPSENLLSALLCHLLGVSAPAANDRYPGTLEVQRCNRSGPLSAEAV